MSFWLAGTLLPLPPGETTLHLDSAPRIDAAVVYRSGMVIGDMDPDMRKLGRKIERMVCSRVLIDSNRDHRSSVFLAGTGRSGTTWVSDILNYRNEYRYVFEPFHSRRVTICRGFRYRQYLRAENKDPAFLAPARAILTGGLKDPWIDSENKRLVSNKRLIKDIRANHLLKWMHANFPGMPIILLLRHPCAVASSRIKLKWDTHLEEFLAQRELMEDHLHPFRLEIERAEAVFDKHIFLWCIENHVPLKQFKKGEIHVCFYEGFCENPEDEIRRMFSFLGKPYDEAVLRNLRIPSSPSRRESAIVAGGSLIEGWKKHITQEQTRRAIEILGLFGLDRIYSEEPLPNPDRAHEILASSRRASSAPCDDEGTRRHV